MNKHPRIKCPLLVGASRTPLIFLALMLALLALAGCSSSSPQAQVSTATPIVSQPVTPEPPSTWVPPTALVGTPIPGAEATLTAAPALKTGTLTFLDATGEEVNMHVEIADTEPSRELGLMFRTGMAPNAGMLFDFGGVTTGGFWMQNTLLPLSIAFVAQDGTILNIEDMQPLDTNTTDASGPYAYAIEANQGYYKANNIVPGGKVLLPVVLDSAQLGPAIPGMPDVGGSGSADTLSCEESVSTYQKVSASQP